MVKIRSHHDFCKSLFVLCDCGPNLNILCRLHNFASKSPNEIKRWNDRYACNSVFVRVSQQLSLFTVCVVVLALHRPPVTSDDSNGLFVQSVLYHLDSQALYALVFLPHFSRSVFLFDTFVYKSFLRHCLDQVEKFDIIEVHLFLLSLSSFRLCILQSLFDLQSATGHPDFAFPLSSRKPHRYLLHVQAIPASSFSAASFISGPQSVMVHVNNDTVWIVVYEKLLKP